MTEPPIFSVPNEITCPEICIACGGDILSERDEDGSARFLDVTMRGLAFRIHQREDCIRALITADFLNMEDDDD